jgi:TonB family protein
MKKLLYLILALLPLPASSNCSVSVVEHQYITTLAKSFTSKKLTAPYTPLFVSLCLGETTALSKPEISKRIGTLAKDEKARTAFYKRLNFYRGYSPQPSANETYSGIYLPYVSNQQNSSSGIAAISVLSHRKTQVTSADWQAYVKYVTDFGEDAGLLSRWLGCGDGPDGPARHIYTITEVETQPVFEGGDKHLLNFLVQQVQYPRMERDNDIQGKVLLRFVICPDGHISQGEIAQAVSPGLDKEAMLILKMLPPFTPAKHNGQAVPVYFTLPIVYRLQ